MVINVIYITHSLSGKDLTSAIMDSINNKVMRPVLPFINLIVAMFFIRTVYFNEKVEFDMLIF